MGILDHFPPGLVPRSEQTAVLEQIEARWNTTDVFCVTAPTALGKTAISMTIANWRASLGEQSNILVPTNILLAQMLESYPDLAVLQRKALYGNEDRYQEAKYAVRAAKVRAMNYHIYMAHKLYATNMICDEGHKLIDIMGDMQQVRLWAADYDFPPDVKTVREVLEWMEEQDLAADPRLAKARKSILSIQDCAVVEYNSALRRGKWDDVLDILPTTVRGFPPFLWPRKTVRKIILLSATINHQDIDELGFSTRKVTYIEADSPIPASNRIVRLASAGNMSHKYLVGAAKEIAAEVSKIMDRNPDSKGLIHVPYAAAEELRKHLKNDRILWHTHDNKSAVLNQFKSSSKPVIMVASGLYEGVDLPYDKARWQVIAKVPFLYLGSEKIKVRMQEDPGWYDWEAIKKVLQATGRIVRAPDDFGVTYILDSNFRRLWLRDCKRQRRLFPQYFREALIL